MPGFFKSGCDQLCCIEKFRSCKMKNDNISVLVQLMLKHEVPKLYFLKTSCLFQKSLSVPDGEIGETGEITTLSAETEKKSASALVPIPLRLKSRLGVQDPEKKRGRVILDLSTVGNKKFLNGLLIEPFKFRLSHHWK